MTRTLRILKPMGRYAAVGDEVRVECDADGTPLDQFWRRRVRDSARDGCVEFVDQQRKRSPKKRAAASQPEEG